ncbi:MAG: glyoxalase, partial [Phenylobacterium sp.]|nr:glyoxalase [Phenylobacterium sp.]
GPARARSPASLDGVCTQFIRVHLADELDTHAERARAAGATIVQEPADQFYGARVYRALDPEGHVWVFSQEVADVPIVDQEAATGLKIRTSLKEMSHG